MLQKIFWPPASTWQAPALSDLPEWKGCPLVGFDVETRDPQLSKLGCGAQRDGYIVGFCIALDDGPSFYLPIRHATGENLPLANVIEYIRQQVKHFDGTLVGGNLSYDLRYLCAELDGFLGRDIFPNVSRFADVQIADALINELHFQYDLDIVAKRWGLETKDESLLKEAGEAFALYKGRGKDRKLDVKSNLWKLDPKYVGPYGEWDAELPLHILKKQEQVIAQEGLQQIWDLECEVLPALVRMSLRGIRVNDERLEEIRQWCWDREQEQYHDIYRYCGKHVDETTISKANYLAPILQGIGASLGRTKKGQWNIDDAALKEINHPVATAMRYAKKINKVRRDFVTSIRNHMVNGRIHCEYSQLRRTKEDGGSSGTITGRLSATHPNMQQQPSPKDTDPETMCLTDDLSLMWRSIYEPEPGHTWTCIDYSQQEPRLLHHYAEITGCQGARAACDRYRNDPSTDNHSMFAEMTGLPRKFAKTVYLGTCYRMGGAKFAKQLGLPALKKNIGTAADPKWIMTAGPEAQAVLDAFDRGAPYVNILAGKAEKEAKRKGYIRTLLGRHLHFDEDENGNLLGVHKAINKLIQGSAADQTKKALVAVDRELLWDDDHILLAQVHDELDFSLLEENRSKRLAELMCDVVSLRVPVKVDVESGPTWGEIS